MHKKLTITVDEKIYDALHSVIGRGNISRFLEDLARPQLKKKKSMQKFSEEEMIAGYKAMAADKEYMKDALEWIESNVDDGLDDETW